MFYRFLEKIGLMKRKSKIIAKICVPDKYFTDFLRGLFDGDGSFYSYFDPRWKSSFMFYTVFCSASPKHIMWLRDKIQNSFGIKGHISKSPSYQQLKYAKSESLILIKHLYKNKDGLRLERKYLKISRALSKLSSR